MKDNKQDISIKENSVSKSTAFMTVATLMSRATGLFRTWSMAFALGNTLVTSAYNVANNLPNVIYELVAGGLLFAAFIPVYLQEKEKFNQERANRFGSNVLNILAIFLGLLAILSTIFAAPIVGTQTFTVNADSQVNEYAIFFFRIFAIQILFYGVGGTITAILNAHRVFFIPSVVPALNNIVVIISFIVYATLQGSNPQLALIILAVGTSLGVLVQFAVQIPALFRCGFKWKLEIHIRDKALLDALKIALPTIIYIAGTMVAFTFRNAFSLEVTDKGPSMLSYAWIWFQLPHGIIAVSISRALFTEMSIAFAKNDKDGLVRLISSGISKTLSYITPFAMLLALLSTSFMRLFAIGAFTEEDSIMISFILIAWAFCLPLYSLLMHLYNIYASVRKFSTFAIIATSMVVLQCFLYWALTSILKALFGGSGALESTANLAIISIPIADFVYYGLSSLILVFLLMKYYGNFGILRIIWSYARVLLATIVAGFILYSNTNFIPVIDNNVLTSFIRLVVYGGLGLCITVVLCLLFRVPDYLEAWRIVIGFIKKKLGKA
ncbi:MAG: murein biosynthesis integral membrane protein MurJ [Enterococcus sp.]|nr:murein biosynthesis integral membrane protein MurJ [Enterococcus sp.]